MNGGLEKKYGLVTAITMVVGIVIGSGAFFKSEIIHLNTGGNLSVGIFAWIIGGLIMLVCACGFAIMAGRYEKVNGVVDYAEALVGSKYAYLVGWFMTTVYYPTLISVLAWLSAKYTLMLAGIGDAASGTCLALAGFYLVLSYAVNALSPVLAGKIQVTATVIKLIPLIVMAVIGTILGIFNGNLENNFNYASEAAHNISSSSALFSGIVSSAFAYEGWIIATSINAELKNSKRNLPIALIGGSLVIIAVYVFYYIGLAGAVPVEDLMNQEKGVAFAFKAIFGNVAGTVLTAFIAVSCLGTLNGLMLGSVRGMYSLASRGEGPSPEIFSQVDKTTNIPVNSGVMGILFSAAWLFYFYGANLTGPLFGVFSFDSSELPVVTIYALYIPVFIMFMIKGDEKSKFRRFVIPGFAVAGSVVMIICAVYAHGILPYNAAKAEGSFSLPVLFYLIFFIVLMGTGLCFYKRYKKS